MVAYDDITLEDAAKMMYDILKRFESKKDRIRELVNEILMNK
jgi:hypothetical protein